MGLGRVALRVWRPELGAVVGAEETTLIVPPSGKREAGGCPGQEVCQTEGPRDRNCW